MGGMFGTGVAGPDGLIPPTGGIDERDARGCMPERPRVAPGSPRQSRPGSACRVFSGSEDRPRAEKYGVSFSSD
jgi:hypothetical protein